MATAPISRASASQCHPLFPRFHALSKSKSCHSIHPSSCMWSRKGTLVCCAPPIPTPPLSSTPISPPALAGQELSLCFGSYSIPHPRKVEKGGEDAFFFSSYNGGIIAVADGVSGWAEKNVNPAQFSREMMSRLSSLLKDEEVSYDPRSLMKDAHAATSSVGSATVIIAILEKNGILKIANVGDCGLRVIRRGQIAFSTSPQEHYFDCPYQLSSEAVTQTYLDAMVCSVELVKGDILVIGSDGLFDNIFDSEIVSTVGASNDVGNTAKALAELARGHSVDLRFDSPYSIEARARGFDVPWYKKLFGMKLTGGKMDDITVVVGRVESS